MKVQVLEHWLRHTVNAGHYYIRIQWIWENNTLPMLGSCWEQNKIFTKSRTLNWDFTHQAAWSYNPEAHNMDVRGCENQKTFDRQCEWTVREWYISRSTVPAAAAWWAVMHWTWQPHSSVPHCRLKEELSHHNPNPAGGTCLATWQHLDVRELAEKCSPSADPCFLLGKRFCGVVTCRQEVRELCGSLTYKLLHSQSIHLRN